MSKLRLPERFEVPITAKDKGGTEHEIDRIVFVREEECEMADTTCSANDDVWTTAKCSACDEEFTVEFRVLRFCPNCGRKVVS